MLKLLDIAYVMPATILLAYGVAKLLESQFGLSVMTPAILIGTFLGLVLTAFRIKKFIDTNQSSNSK